MQDIRTKRKPTGRHPGLRSVDNRLCNFKVRVKFVNATKRDVDALWASYDHDYILYDTLKPRQVYSINTYVGHPWVFEDTHTRDPMVVQGSEIWWPPPEPSVIIFITLPVLSLRTLAARVVRNHLRSGEDALKLELPVALQKHVMVLTNALQFHKNRLNFNWADEPASQEPTDLEKERIVLVALILHEVLNEIKGNHVSHLTLMSVQLFLQYIQTKVDPHHAAVQALLMDFQTFMDSDDTWLELDRILLNHVEEIMREMLKLVDMYSTVNQVRSVLNFIELTTVNVITKYGSSNRTLNEV